MQLPTAAWVFLILVPPLFLTALVIGYAVNVPYGDLWELVPMIQNYHQGTLGFDMPMGTDWA